MGKRSFSGGSDAFAFSFECYSRAIESFVWHDWLWPRGFRNTHTTIERERKKEKGGEACAWASGGLGHLHRTARRPHIAARFRCCCSPLNERSWSRLISYSVCPFSLFLFLQSQTVVLLLCPSTTRKLNIKIWEKEEEEATTGDNAITIPLLFTPTRCNLISYSELQPSIDPEASRNKRKKDKKKKTLNWLRASCSAPTAPASRYRYCTRFCI